MNHISAVLSKMLALLPAGVCAGICQGARWQVDQCNRALLKFFEKSPKNLGFRPGENEQTPFLGKSLLEFFCHHGEVQTARRLMASKPNVPIGMGIGNQQWAFVWTWVASNEEKPVSRFFLLHEMPEHNGLVEQYLHDQELQTIMDSVHDGLWIIDGKGITLHVNKSLKRIANINPEEMVGKHVSEPLREGKFSSAVTLEALKRRKPISQFDDYPNGARCLNTSTPIFDKKGNIWRVVACIRDMTELERLEQRLAEAELAAYRYKGKIVDRQQELGTGFIANSKSMCHCLQKMNKAAKAPLGILILGETGTGKTHAAACIHQKSQRAKGPLVTLNCAAIPPTLIESELFGYEKGAFTGARQTGKRGFFEQANKGTLLLDEIGELPLNMQAKILHVLDGQSFYKIGGEKEISVDVRIIAATNRPLDQLVSSGKFRADLYYRLQVLSISIPPLREHPDDIPVLMMTFLDEACRRYGTVKTFSPKVVECFVSHTWPGNVRELRAAVEFLAAMTEGSVIRMGDLPPYLLGSVSEQDISGDFSQEETTAKFRDAVDNLERKLLREALTLTGSTYKAAVKLGLSQSTVVRKARRLGVSIVDK
ncbi:MAG: sigma 54-interacting transcriptional regulator [Desulfovibrio sp.]|jgi:PAS domain S-box-containing protein|nr:sigma 54-interacting transcriptional regulator [Desulfovibrio sp.]